MELIFLLPKEGGINKSWFLSIRAFTQRSPPENKPEEILVARCAETTLAMQKPATITVTKTTSLRTEDPDRSVFSLCMCLS
mmetsp:Transcript_14394/g.36180  ORF Transcript_14394/g.36180 Transcript_14394/m.36180 type:complete len:81 (-) Transcript_14394:2782-3024(-)